MTVTRTGASAAAAGPVSVHSSLTAGDRVSINPWLAGTAAVPLRLDHRCFVTVTNCVVTKTH